MFYIFMVAVCVLAFSAGFFVGKSRAYKDGYDAGYKTGNEGGFTEDEKDSIRQVLSVLTFGADKKDED